MPSSSVSSPTGRPSIRSIRGGTCWRRKIRSGSARRNATLRPSGHEEAMVASGATPVDFWYEFASTYSYVAAMRIERLAAAAGVSVNWRPFLLGPIFRAQGWDTSPFNLYLAKGRYMWRDLERLCEREGIPWRRPTMMP